ncbi:hypothetical protein [Streptomyces sp. MS2.AVA.5]|uniref:Uncharacterized protein n=1 Tax=Streptomyces achmelvichensis TaxID=3134111 RepID=A0ACC6PKV7_9ACTN
MSTPYSFPDDLRALQLELSRVRAAYEAHCHTLPWSVNPMTGVTYERPLMGGRVEPVAHPDSPGYTPEQFEADRTFRSKLVELAAAIHAHPWWADVPKGEGVDARMALKHVEAEQPAAESAV